MKKGTIFAVTAFALLVSVLAVGYTPARPAPAVTLSGTVKTDDGKPLRGAVVTVTSGNRSISRFADQTGQFTIPGLEPGNYRVAATAWARERKMVTKDLSGKTAIDFVLASSWQPARQLSSAQWYASLPKNEETDQLEYQCMTCHNGSNLVKYKGATAADWHDIVVKMGNNVLNDGEMAGARKQALEWVPVLEKYFGPNAPSPTQDQVSPPQISDAVLKATFREYDTPATTYVHSLTVDPVREQVYFTEIDRPTNALGQFDIKTEKITEHKFLTDFSQPHNAIVSPDGKVWVSLNNAQAVGMYDPAADKVAEFPAVAVGHTIDVDWNGIIWESGPGLFKFDPRTKESKQYPLERPADDAGASTKGPAMAKATANCGTYDLAVGLRTDVWFTCGGGGYIGKLDSETEKVRTYKVPNGRSMKGITVDAAGNVWFSSFTDHKLGKLDAKTGEMKLFQPPTAHAGFYGLLIDRNNGDLWLSDYEGSRITRFNPKTEQFTEYPLPRNDGMPRFMGQDAEGRIWYTEWKGKIGVLDPGDLPPAQLVTKMVRASRQ